MKKILMSLVISVALCVVGINSVFAATVKALVIGGGGGGGYNGGGGGGAGGYQDNASFTVTAQAYSITVGGGGTAGTSSARGGNGSNSVFNTITATGGGGGGSRDSGQITGANGGSGGGGAGATDQGTPSGGTGSQGNDGGDGESNGTNFVGGGGGGASVAGASGVASTNVMGDGGDGTSNSISGTATYYSGGGGGGMAAAGATGGAGGSGGGGAGGTPVDNSGTAGTANTGGGGGAGSGGGASIGGAGGSGIVIMSYATDGSDGVGTKSTGGTITTSGDQTIHTFTSSGTFTVVAVNFTPAALFTGCAVISQATDGTGKVTAEVEIDDAEDDDQCEFLAEYSTGAFSTWTKATLSEDDSDTTATYGDPKVANADTYQVGNASGYITTSTGANKVSFVWLSGTDVPSADGSYKLRITPYGGMAAGTAVESSAFALDNAAPSESGATVIIDSGATYSQDSTLDFTWSGFADTNTISTYYYSFTDNGGTENGTEGSSPGQLSGASEGTVSVYVWAEDEYGNIGNAASDSIIVDTNAPSAPQITGFLYDEQGRITQISGTAEAYSTVNVYDGGVYLGETTADENGNWTFTPAIPLNAGPHSISTITEDAAQNPSDDSYYYSLNQNIAVNVYQDTTTYKTDGVSMRMEREASYEFKFAVNTTSPVTVSAYLQKNASYGSQTDPTITLTGLGIDGAGAATASGGAVGSWTELTVGGAPNADGVLKLKVETFSTESGAEAWIDDISITQ